ncbi:Na+/H+ antiporter NhaC family protein [Romboutsia weinsteinii]|uniref:Na+/H+ antiporter NhaC family protein n=1 Tax=Romboutsia weinsteinii TaxID=2020949 RepID=A0A371JA77_9FIRM|nr:Na+/H+ antiporter NhaC family protein [Romboutsia weinsteinii]RDY29671.1 Na+/H+ antiporter NhaC family protein [Romboutsia weinsteinii]
MEHFGILSLLPPLVAIIMAVFTKNVIISLFTGTLVGVTILSGYNPIVSVKSLIGDYFFEQLTDGYNAGVLVLLVFIGGFIALMETSGGAHAFAQKVTKFINTKTKAQISAWFGGIIIFFSDLGTPLIIGPIFEPIFDKLKISREKLAWIIDSTASPVAVLVPFIGWGVYVMGLIQKEFEALSITQSDFTAFIKAIPFQIYPILALVMIPLIAFTKLDFAAMLRAERRVETTGKLHWDTSNPQRKSEKLSDIEVKNAKASLVIVPLIVLFVTLFGMLIPLGFPFKKIDGSEFRIALTTGYLFAAIVLMVLMVYYKTKKFSEIFSIYISGMQKMMYVSITLILAWSLGSVIKNLGTANYIIQVLQGNIPGFLIPAILFILGACVSFSTGSSWGTFAIMMPLAIPMAVSLDASIYVCIGAVLSGGLFGDHCSPISDTTILSSTGAGCDLIDHVKTQLPYAILNGIIAFVTYLIAGFIDSEVSLVVAIIMLVITVLTISKLK